MNRNALPSIVLTLIALPVVALAQTPPTTTVKKSPQPAAPAKAAPAAAEKVAEPATVEEAAKVLDLRTFPVMEGAKIGSLHTLGMLMYEAKGTTAAAYEFQRKELLKRGFKELPGTYTSKETHAGHFTKDGFVVAASASDAGYDPAKAGMSSVAVINSGNVALDKLPLPPGTKPFHPRPTEASYTTTAKVEETAAACRKLLLAAGWEPYGKAVRDPNQPDSSMEHFKRSAIKLQLWVMTTPAEGGKTLIRYTTDLLQADLPFPPETADPRYSDHQKTLRFDSPQDQTDAILAFYQEKLPKQGWKATTERPILDQRNRSQFLVFRNANKDLLYLDLAQYTDIVRVTLKHQNEQEFAEEERLFKEKAEQERLAEAKRNMKVNVAVPLPAKAANLEKSEANLFEFTLATGSGAAALEAFRQHFTKEGWTEEKGAKFDKTTGDLDFKKGEASLGFSYSDIGFGDVEIRVSASKNVVLEPIASKDRPAADAPMAKAKPPVIPGLPALPPGVELPADVEALLKKALEDAGQAAPPAKKPAKKAP